MIDWDGLETPLGGKPLFLVEARPALPDDRTKWPEEYRQRSFVAWVRKHHPEIIAASITNEGKRSVYGGMRRKQAGLTPGMPDIVVIWDGGMAFIEFKGAAASGAWGRLSEHQIETCNKIHRNGHPVGCFYTATGAIAWLRSVGCPLRDAA